jgi:hypothetical protein
MVHPTDQAGLPSSCASARYRPADCEPCWKARPSSSTSSRDERDPRRPTCDHGKHACRDDAPLPPATQGWRARPMRTPPCPGAEADGAGQWLSFPCGVTGRAGGRDAEGRRGAAVRPGLAGLPGRPRPAPQLEGRHGVVPCLRPALAAGRGGAVPLARPGSAVGPGRQGAGRVPFPRCSSVRGAARGDRGGPPMTELATGGPCGRGGSPTHRNAALQARRYVGRDSVHEARGMR